MPIHDFVCEKCGNIDEVITRSADITIDICSKCGAETKKVFSIKRFRFQLKYDPKKDRVSWGNEGYATTRRYEQYDKQAKHNIFDMSEKK